jgi:predicted DNA binding CopG/RHH family protein
MESQKLDSEISVRLHSETIAALKKKAEEQRRKLAEYIRLTLEDAANAEK